MANKRKHYQSDSSPSKRSRPYPPDNCVPFIDGRSAGYEIKSHQDPATGQWGAFPGLDVENGGDGLFYGPADDGLEYLRMVRAEAETVPHILLAAQEAQKGRATSDARGAIQSAAFWSDEAIVAQSSSDEAEDDHFAVDNEVDPQDAYYAALISRFKGLRQSISQSSLAGNAISSSANVCTATDIETTYKDWYFAFTQHPPIYKHIVVRAQAEVLIGIERLEKLLTKRNVGSPKIRANLGAWSFALLAKCRDSSVMVGEEVAVLRSFAKTAQRLQNKLVVTTIGPTLPAQDEEDDENDEVGLSDDAQNNEAHETRQLDLETARQKLLAAVDPDVVQPQDAAEKDGSLRPDLMLLDSIVTIVGQMYSQRDLLEQRPAW